MQRRKPSYQRISCPNRKGDSMEDKQEPLTESYFFILLCIYREPMHGYGIMQETLRLSGGRVAIGSGTMYGAVSNMIKKKWIVELQGKQPEDKKRRLYRLTETGKEILLNEIERLKGLVACAVRTVEADRGKEQ